MKGDKIKISPMILFNYHRLTSPSFAFPLHSLFHSCNRYVCSFENQYTYKNSKTQNILISNDEKKRRLKAWNDINSKEKGKKTFQSRRYRISGEVVEW